MNTTPKYNTDDEVFPRVIQCVLEPKPFEFAQLYEGPPTDMCECTLSHPPVQVGIVKKVRFGEDNVKTFGADRFDNICEKSPEPFDPTIHISGIDPIGFISSELLLGTDDVVKKYPVDIVMDCILNIMEIIYSITELNTCNVIYYRGGLSVCNRTGKNQKPVLERKLEQIMICV
jgi:hypothetical protein